MVMVVRAGTNQMLNTTTFPHYHHIRRWIYFNFYHFLLEPDSLILLMRVSFRNPDHGSRGKKIKKNELFCQFFKVNFHNEKVRNSTTM
jgi:hypothetical protein